MKIALACGAALLCAAPTMPATPTGQHNTRTSAVFPPPRYHATEVALPVLYVNNVGPYCGPATPGYRVLACVRKLPSGQPVMVLMNPCHPAFRGEFYAHIACHEKAHAVGWTGMHEE